MRKSGKRLLLLSLGLIVLFVVWTMIIQTVDVKAVGVNGTLIGLASINTWFHKLTGVHMNLYVITDWLGLVPIFVCMILGFVGFKQLVSRRSLFKVDIDIIVLGIYYVLVIFGYLIFEMIPINYRPILIDGFLEASYPSSTTLLVLSVMPTLSFQSERRLNNEAFKRIIRVFAICFSLFMVIGRLVSGVHWLSDIVGSLLLSSGLYLMYKAIIMIIDESKK